jgi:hypothetical protein
MSCCPENYSRIPRPIKELSAMPLLSLEGCRFLAQQLFVVLLAAFVGSGISSGNLQNSGSGEPSASISSSYSPSTRSSSKFCAIVEDTNQLEEPTVVLRPSNGANVPLDAGQAAPHLLSMQLGQSGGQSPLCMMVSMVSTSPSRVC